MEEQVVETAGMQEPEAAAPASQLPEDSVRTPEPPAGKQAPEPGPAQDSAPAQPEAEAGTEQAFRRAVEPELTRLKARDAELYRDLDADHMLSEPRFLQLLGAGLSIEEAYGVLYPGRVQERLRQQARADVVRDIEARGLRPAEGAARPSGAGGAALDIEGLTREELRDIRRRVLRGEHITL